MSKWIPSIMSKRIYLRCPNCFNRQYLTGNANKGFYRQYLNGWFPSIMSKRFLPTISKCSISSINYSEDRIERHPGIREKRRWSSTDQFSIASKAQLEMGRALARAQYWPAELRLKGPNLSGRRFAKAFF